MPEPENTAMGDSPQAKQPVVPEMIAATDKSFSMGADGARVTLQLHAPKGPVRLRRPELQEVFLLVENVTGDKPAPNFFVYLNVPARENPKGREDHEAGVMGLFGLPEISDAQGRHGGSGMEFSFDITRLCRSLQERRLWNTQEVTVSFVASSWSVPIPEVKVGRVSLYLQ